MSSEAYWKIIPEAHSSELSVDSVNYNSFVWIIHSEHNKGDLAVNNNMVNGMSQFFIWDVDQYEHHEKYTSNSIFVI